MEEWKPVEESSIPRVVWVVGGAAVLIGIGAAYYYYFRDQAPTAPPPPAVVLPAPAPVAAAPEQPKIRNPLPGDDLAKAPLPSLNDSDAPMRQSLGSIADLKTLDQYLVPKDLVRNLVVTVDNLSRPKIAVERRPLKATQGAFVVKGEGDDITLGEENFARYSGLITLVKNADARKVADLYIRYYPLFQRAYEDQGYPDDYFNDRLVDVIDHLLATPEPAGPIKLVQPRVFYEYADPNLEGLSSGQKLLIRIGPANAAEVKKKLRELKSIIAKMPPPAETAAPVETPAPVESPAPVETPAPQ